MSNILHGVSTRPARFWFPTLTGVIVAAISAIAAGASPIGEAPSRFTGAGSIEALHALQAIVADIEPGLDVRIYGPEELLRAQGLNPLNTGARATSWLAVLPFTERNAAVWIVASATDRGISIRSGVYRVPSRTFIGRIASAVTDRLPTRWQPPETQIARMIGNRTYEFSTPMRRY